MAQPIELILMRQLAGYLSTPVILTDRQDDVLFFNEAAEAILGRRFDETERMSFEEFYGEIQPAEEDGTPRKLEDTGMYIARTTGHPVHRRTLFLGLEAESGVMEVTSVPVMGSEDSVLGVAVFFWARKEDSP